VDVVRAGVHHSDVVSVFVCGADVAGVGAARVFDYRQRVEVGAHHDRGARSVLHDGDEAVASDVGGDLKAQWL
jgi:hypothetical protein